MGHFIYLTALITSRKEKGKEKRKRRGKGSHDGVSSIYIY